MKSTNTKWVPDFKSELDVAESREFHFALRDALISTIEREGWGRIYVSGMLLGDNDLMLAVAQRVRKDLFERGYLIRRMKTGQGRVTDRRLDMRVQKAAATSAAVQTDAPSVD